MNRRLVLGLAVALLAVGQLSASQFVRLPFDQVAREATLVVRGTLGPVTSQWDDAREVIYSRAVLRVNRYLGGVGPETLVVREVGGTVGDYTQQAIGFPELREGEEVVLFLQQWDDGADWRIHAFNQGKFLVRSLRGVDSLTPDPVQQGDDRLARQRVASESVDDAITVDEFASMVRAARGTITPNARTRD
jgi:hypothetical protein